MDKSVYLLSGALGLITYLLFRGRTRRSPISSKSDIHALPSLLVPAYTSHSRSLPIPSRHTFSYPLLYVAADLESLTSQCLDLPYNLFSYGGSPTSKVLGLRSHGYLEVGEGGLREKLDKVLRENGMPDGADHAIDRVWLVTMPSFLGFEGINPLTVWYCYRGFGVSRRFVCIVLEVHNTFGEKHAYVLKTDSIYRQEPPSGYDYSWTFPRSFHVSPFNSRNGFYRLDLIDPFPASSVAHLDPRIKVSLYLLTPNYQSKLHADLVSHPSRPAIPLDAKHTSSIIKTIFRYPLALLLTTPRILYQAYRLHYERKLAVYPRPEPRALKFPGEAEWNATQEMLEEEGMVGVGLGWQPPGWGERKAEEIIKSWSTKRTMSTGINLKVVFRDKRETFSTVAPAQEANGKQNGVDNSLVITTSDPKFFTALLVSPTAQHFLTIAPELSTSISSPELFQRFFPSPSSRSLNSIQQYTSSLRERYLRFYLAHSSLPPPPHLLLFSAAHFLTSPSTSILTQLDVLLIVGLAYFADWIEEAIMATIGAKFVAGREPWALWERALKRLYDTANITKDRETPSGVSSLADDPDFEMGSIRF